MIQNKIQIDEHGQIFEAQKKISNAEVGLEILENLSLSDGYLLTSVIDSEKVIVESFDHPLVAQKVFLQKGPDSSEIYFSTVYGGHWKIELDQIFLDEWDRFLGYTKDKIPWVMSPKAQENFFELLQEYDDESITFNDETYDTPPFWQDETKVNTSSFWNAPYQGDNNPGWNLAQPAPALVDMLPRLRLPRSRVLVAGCGEGHDAAHFAKAGHFVTAVDFSPLAIERAKKLYGDLNIRWVVGDVFKTPETTQEKYDLVFEHTCYCAVNPTKRPDLVKVWSNVLSEDGHLMGVFFTFASRQGPPFGSTEWEIRQRLKKNFEPLFWGRWENSAPGRQGKETYVYARRISRS